MDQTLNELESAGLVGVLIVDFGGSRYEFKRGEAASVHGWIVTELDRIAERTSCWRGGMGGGGELGG